MVRTRRIVVAALSTVIAASVVAATGAPSRVTAGGGPGIRSDFDGDGYADIAIGAPFDDVNGQADAGVVHVFYGSATGLQAADSQVWHQDRPSVSNTAEAGDRFGRGLTTGDFDQDGYEDLAVGVPGEDLGGVVDQGGVNIIYGSGDGLFGDTDQPLLPRANEAYAGAEIGFALEAIDTIDDAGSDFSRDGRADLAIGMPGHDGRGKVMIFSGEFFDRDGLHALAIVAEPDMPVTPGARLGSVLAAGDRSATAQYLAAGAPLDASSDSSRTGIPKSGAVFVVTNGRNVTPIRQGARYGDVQEEGDRFGSALATGDIDGEDDSDELVIGAPYEDIGSHVDAGLVHVLLPVTCPIGQSCPSGMTLHEDSAGVPGVRSPGDRFGAALAVGEFGFGFGQDLAVGVPSDDVGGSAAGAVTLIYNNMTGQLETDPTINDRFHQGSPGFVERPEAADLFGATLYRADIDADSLGFDELVIGIVREDVRSVLDAGAIDVLRGDYEGMRPMGSYLHQDSSGVGEQGQRGDSFGSALP
jgi:hypothetical protein